jgi:hypothetical protein
MDTRGRQWASASTCGHLQASENNETLGAAGQPRRAQVVQRSYGGAGHGGVARVEQAQEQRGRRARAHRRCRRLLLVSAPLPPPGRCLVKALPLLPYPEVHSLAGKRLHARSAPVRRARTSSSAGTHSRWLPSLTLEGMELITAPQ